jgi:hypothetical protein
MTIAGGESRAAGGPIPVLSVVVTIVEGVAALPRFLRALSVQDDPPGMEILVPVDASVDGALSLRDEFPSVRFLDLGVVPTRDPVGSASGQHELYDRRRSAALAAARGDIVAILEDRGLPRPDWARTAVRLHREPWAVIGGAIEPAPCRLIDWALYVCDYSRYALPFDHGPVDWVSDVNVTYKRSALDSTRALWQDRFHEPAVHWELQRRGESLVLAPDLVVDHHREVRPLGRLLAERFHWGRLFGYIRAREFPWSRRLVLVVAAPLIPFLLLARHFSVHRRRGDAARFARAIPILGLFLATWTLGEAWGTLTGRP